MNEIVKMVIVTTVICAFSATLLGSLKFGLEERIARQEDVYVRGPTIKEIMANCPNDPLVDKVMFEYKDEIVGIYPWIEEGVVRRIALEQLGPGGYGGDVTVMTAIDLESDNIFGVRVTQHKETPGVGTRVMVPDYLSKYKKLSISGELKLGNDIDAVSGATRTSTGVVNGVNKAAALVRENKDTIVNLVQNKGS